MFDQEFFEFQAEGVPKSIYLGNPTEHPITDITMNLVGEYASNMQITQPLTSPLIGRQKFTVVLLPGSDCPIGKPEVLLVITGKSCGEDIQATFKLFANCYAIRQNRP